MTYYVTVHAHNVLQAIDNGISGLVLATGETLPALAKDSGMLASSRDAEAVPLALDPAPRRLTDAEREEWTEALASAKTRWPWA